MNNKLDVDAIINQMINSGGRNVKIREKDISHLCKITREIFMEQPVFLELEAPIKICGKWPHHSTSNLQCFLASTGPRGSLTCVDTVLNNMFAKMVDFYQKSAIDMLQKIHQQHR